ncbi:MAG TPA: prepilin-type N-terminal cleavage/methylation domain-containing protein [Planctomycetota bacterium]|nr:prepilin-type N-terminal cleavage/methylation domain-containing protein [Planctomycetota bacterium]
MKRRSGRRAQDQGFTLIELLISIALMMILIIAVTMIFVTTTDVVAVQEARMTVYTNARYAMDIMANDLLGAYGLNEPPRPGQKNGPNNQNAGGGQTYIPGEHIPQQFWMDNGELPRSGDSIPDGGGELPVLNKSSDPKAHFERAGDAMGFRTVTTVGDSIQTCEVTYLLVPGDHVLDTPPPGSVSPINRPMGDLGKFLQSGDATHTKTARTKRPIYTLVRRVRMQNPALANGEPVFDQIPQVKDKQGNMVVVQDQELCYYVVSFNLEYLASNRAFSQLSPSPFPHDDPLGNNSGPNDTGGTAYRVPEIRATLRVVEDAGERQERTIQKVMWIPQQ